MFRGTEGNPNSPGKTLAMQIWVKSTMGRETLQKLISYLLMSIRFRTRRPPRFSQRTHPRSKVGNLATILPQPASAEPCLVWSKPLESVEPLLSRTQLKNRLFWISKWLTRIQNTMNNKTSLSWTWIKQVLDAIWASLILKERNVQWTKTSNSAGSTRANSTESKWPLNRQPTRHPCSLPIWTCWSLI